MKSNSG